MRVAAVVTAGVLALAGCGGDEDSGGGAGDGAGTVNTFEDKTAAQVLGEAKKAAQGAKSVHMTGDLSEGSSSFKIDMLLSDDQGGQGSITIDGDEMALRQVGDVIYVKGSKEVWASMVPGAAKVADDLDGAWVRIKAGDDAASRFADITSMDQAFDGLLRESGKTLSKVKGKDVAGTPTIGLLDKGETAEDAATMYIATRGPAYPLLVEPNTGNGKISFSEWDKDVKVEAPSGKTVDLAKVLKP
jgi:hypothetical protein